MESFVPCRCRCATNKIHLSTCAFFFSLQYRAREQRSKQQRRRTTAFVSLTHAGRTTCGNLKQKCHHQANDRYRSMPSKPLRFSRKAWMACVGWWIRHLLCMMPWGERWLILPAAAETRLSNVGKCAVASAA